MEKISKHYLYFCLILFGIFLLRVPSLFEPLWYGDEGIFAAVARNLNLGGVLYQTAWDNKPPMIYLTYSSIFKWFGVSEFNIHMAALIAVLVTAALIYEMVVSKYSARRALVAMGIFGILSSLRVFEGNLALTEVFMVMFTALGMFVAIKRKFDYFSLFVAGIFFAIASLYKQVGAFEAAALGIYLFFISKNFAEFVKRGILLTLGFSIPYLITVGYFAKMHLLGDYIFAAYTYYRIYLNESPQYAILINVFKYAPIILAIVYCFFKKRQKELSVFNLFILWLCFSFLGSYFSGRAYGHYMVQILPALSVVLATVPPSLVLWRAGKFELKKVSIAFGVGITLVILILTRLLFPNIFGWNPGDQFKYYGNFLNYVIGNKSLDSYNNFFDGNVSRIMAANDFLQARNATGKSVYIWGDLPWIYATSGVWNPSRYVTSFHVFGVPNGKAEVMASIAKNPPIYILKPPRSIGEFNELENLLASNYTLVSNIEGTYVYALMNSTRVKPYENIPQKAKK
jgi:4-amino-4-deoxy-L-arabinose transferase-like glycosyltransferase